MFSLNFPPMLSSRLIAVSGLILVIGCGIKPRVTAWHTPNQPEVVEKIKVIDLGGSKDTVVVKRTRFYSNGQMADQLRFRDGVPHGKYKAWWPNGIVKITGRYTFGQPDKKWVYTSQSGITDSIRTYSNNILDGDYIDNHADGTPKLFLQYSQGVLHGKIRQYDKNRLRLSGLFQWGQKNGEWVWIDETGNRDSVRTYLNGTLDGKLEDYSEDGILIKRQTYRLNKLEGPVSEFYSNGVKKLQGHYLNEIPDGKWTWWDENGNQIRTIHYQNGVKHGKYAIYEPAKKRIQSGGYFMDERHGKWVWYNEEGKPDSVIGFDKGVKHGRYKRWHRNGIKSVVGSNISGKPDGKWTWFNSSGAIDSVKKYSDGKLDGDSEFYHPDGVLSLSQPYSMGLKSGEMKSYYSNGQQDAEWTYVAGKRQGPYSIWSRSGAIREAGSYANDKPDGIIERYFSSGGRSSVVTYKDGIPHGVLRVFNTSGNVVKEQYFIHGDLICEFQNYSDGTRKQVSVFNGDTLIFEETWDSYGQDKELESMDDIKKKTDYYISGIVKAEKGLSAEGAHGVQWEFNEDRTVKSIQVCDQGTIILKRRWLAGNTTSNDTLFHHGHCRCIIADDGFKTEPDLINTKTTETE